MVGVGEVTVPEAGAVSVDVGGGSVNGAPQAISVSGAGGGSAGAGNGASFASSAL